MGTYNKYWFDAVMVFALIGGLIYGRKGGLSTVLLPMLKWLAVVILCGTFYKDLGSYMATSLQIQPNLAYVVVYLVLAGIVIGVFTAVKNALGEKLVGAAMFGKAEFPLGALAGAVQAVCVIFTGLALLCSAYVTEAELAEPVAGTQTTLAQKFSPASIQRGVFKVSNSGPVLKTYLGHWLIAAQPPVQYEAKKIEGFGRKMEKAIDEDLGGPAKK